MNYVSSGQLTHALWYKTLRAGGVANPTDVEILQGEKYDFVRKTILGGRSYGCIREFVSKEFDLTKFCEKYDITGTDPSKISLREPAPNVMGVSYKSVQDYVNEKDATSLYPDAQSNPMPLGKLDWVEPSEIADLEKGKPVRPGFYHVCFDPNPNLLHAAVPTHDKNGAMVWSLEPAQEGHFCYIDVERMLAQNYRITKVIKALLFVEDRQAALFKEYIDRCFEIKKRGEDEKNPTLRQIGKIMGNSLYGKQGQKPVLSIIETAFTKKQFLAFRMRYPNATWEGVLRLGENHVILFGSTENARNKFPVQYASLTLAFARRTMDTKAYSLLDSTFYKEHPDYDELERAILRQFFGGDTDAVYIHCLQNHLIDDDQKARGVSGSDLGEMKSEAEEKKRKKGKILYQFWVGPKKKCEVLINYLDELFVKITSAGIAHHSLDLSKFLQVRDGEIVTVAREAIKTFGMSSNPKNFMMVANETTTRSLRPLPWKRVMLNERMEVDAGGNYSVPIGHTFTKPEFQKKRKLEMEEQNVKRVKV